MEASTRFIDTEELNYEWHDVEIIRVSSPLLFWVRLRNGEENLRDLLTDLATSMDQKGRHLSLTPRQITEELLVATRYKNEWQRGEVVEVDLACGRALVTLGDLGLTRWIPSEDLYILEEQYQQLPWQAIACGLAHIAPPAPTNKWPQKTRALCRLLAEKEKGEMLFTYPLRPGAALVELDIHGPGDEEMAPKIFNLKEELIHLGHIRADQKITVDTFPAV